MVKESRLRSRKRGSLALRVLESFEDVLELHKTRYVEITVIPHADDASAAQAIIASGACGIMGTEGVVCEPAIAQVPRSSFPTLLRAEASPPRWARGEVDTAPHPRFWGDALTCFRDSLPTRAAGRLREVEDWVAAEPLLCTMLRQVCAKEQRRSFSCSCHCSDVVAYWQLIRGG